MRYWRDQGVPAEKLILGFAAYGRTFTLSTQSSEIGAPISGAGTAGHYTMEAGFWSYYEVCLYLKGKTVQWIEDQKVPYDTTENQWVGFDNKDSINAKVNYLTANNFGGVSVWSLDLDDFNGKFCEQGKYPLISHLRSLLMSGAPATTTAEKPGNTAVQTTPNPETPPVDSTDQHGSITSAITTTTTTMTSAGKPDTQFCIGKTSGLYPNPNDPNSFYNCFNNITYVQKCPSGLVYQDSCKCCNWP
ncbi:chitotriosidase-1-like protein [Lates japonicus]|uniref:chitinase n=1 Tax=Lates japonicus TaxID=270547 RepID=A0AAD3MAG4_LATJO|nr:chitotriosidase-1-like protein [Lates japonicus]